MLLSLFQVLTSVDFMRTLGLIFLSLVVSSLWAKEVRISANVVSTCATKLPPASAPLDITTTQQGPVDCKQGRQWAAISKREEQQWQRVFIDY